MSKFFLFYFIWRLTGNPILAVIILICLYYLIDRRYIGFLPSVTNPFRKRFRISHLKKQLDLNPHDMNAKYELAQAYLEGKYPKIAFELLKSLSSSMQESADVICDIGLCHLLLGELETGEKLVLHALEMKHNLRYGDPYLALGSAFSKSYPAKALQYYEQYQVIHSSSCMCQYRMGQLYQQAGNHNAAKQAWSDCLETYRILPKFRKRHERRWALAARLKLLL